MPSARIVMSAKAENDLRAIGRYIAEHDGLTRALMVVERIDKPIDNLAFMPRMGGRRTFLKRGRLAFSAPPWTIIYVPLSDGIRVLRVLDGRRDIATILGKP